MVDCHIQSRQVGAMSNLLSRTKIQYHLMNALTQLFFLLVLIKMWGKDSSDLPKSPHICKDVTFSSQARLQIFIKQARTKLQAKTMMTKRDIRDISPLLDAKKGAQCQEKGIQVSKGMSLNQQIPRKCMESNWTPFLAVLS